jgi:hypothetical protein
VGSADRARHGYRGRTAIYGMPVDQAVLSAAEGATFGLFPIMWIVVAGSGSTT